MKFQYFLLLAFVSGIFFSCVPKAKYQAQLAESRKQEQENARLQRLLNISKSNSNFLNDSLEVYKSVSFQTKNQLDSSLMLVEKAQLENDTLMARLKEQAINFATTQEALEKQEKNLKILRYRQYQRKLKSSELKKGINSALGSLSKEQFSVKEQAGRVYISLSNKLLFETASIEINPSGQTALKKLGKLLKKYSSSLDIWVEGHTDNVPVTGEELPFDDNWQLSALRAAVVVKILVAQGISPKQIMAAGRGEYIPIASNKTASGKAQNRRIEIVLLPKLDELFELMNK